MIGEMLGHSLQDRSDPDSGGDPRGQSRPIDRNRLNGPLSHSACIGLHWESMTTRIAIPEPTSRDTAYNQRSLPQYIAAIQSAGAVATVIPLHERQDRVARLLASVQGILLPGSGYDLDPQAYGEIAYPRLQRSRSRPRRRGRITASGRFQPAQADPRHLLWCPGSECMAQRLTHPGFAAGWKGRGKSRPRPRSARSASGQDRTWLAACQRCTRSVGTSST